LPTSKRVLQKNKENGSLRNSLALQTWFCLYQIHPKEPMDVQSKCGNFPRGAKFEAITVPPITYY
jgi:hypothetical protein